MSDSATNARNLEALLLNLKEEFKVIQALGQEPLVDERKNGYYAIQVRNHIRRIEYNITEALDYLEFITGKKVVK